MIRQSWGPQADGNSHSLAYDIVAASFRRAFQTPRPAMDRREAVLTSVQYVNTHNILGKKLFLIVNASLASLQRSLQLQLVLLSFFFRRQAVKDGSVCSELLA